MVSPISRPQRPDDEALTLLEVLISDLETALDTAREAATAGAFSRPDLAALATDALSRVDALLAEFKV